MKFAAATVVGFLLADMATAFAPCSSVTTKQQRSTLSPSSLNMALDVPPPVETSTTRAGEAPAVVKNQYGVPSDVRYSDFLNLVNANKVEKVTFSADGTQLLGVDKDGTKMKIEALPNDPGLLSQLTDHKVCMYVCALESLFFFLFACCCRKKESMKSFAS